MSPPSTDQPPAALRVEMTINSDPSSLAVVRGAVTRMAELGGLDETGVHNVTWAIDEALANVIKHGYEGRPDQPIHLTLEGIVGPDGRRGLAVTVRDRGKQVDPATICGRDLADVRPGGLGVHIMRTVMDEVEFSCPMEGGMLLRMVKYVQQGEARCPDRPEGTQP